MVLSDSTTIKQYKSEMSKSILLAMPYLNPDELDKALDYSVEKRFSNSNCIIDNTYTKKKTKSTILKMADYIADRQPIVTAYGTMFKKHGEVPNPLGEVISEFMELRDKDKIKMLSYPKGNEMYEQYNLKQQLDKIDTNGMELPSVVRNCRPGSKVSGE